ncbi:hypothetical protein [Deinococcus cellulosilyticus]|uniref:Lipoprotein n=1 Tax=Deinococcus cellulosilyticus (strain DSM 18568 / NBRC 106333 / KACC 11606 / 5516J-15) TaxID=1223518 RepID=A0A511N8J8_DEIC1|nr:hypothetical protein [Deinococcus cellulosilyticus]GEM48857.1 hypothetical protein DC3_44920 [Deinococcus cellulosilyticus NBRC 106333 = KACC 11606]
MKQPVVFLLIAALMSACTVTTQTSVQPKPQAAVVAQPKTPPSKNLGDYALPDGASNIKVKSNKVEFSLGKRDLGDVFEHFDNQFKRKGWLRVGVENRPNRVEATYKFENNLVRLTVKREGNSGKFEVELED